MSGLTSKAVMLVLFALVSAVSGSADAHPQVFLGGSCNPTTWRADDAIPFLEKNGITFYNPQVDDWHEGLVAAEAEAKETAVVSLFVIGTQTSSWASIGEVIQLICEKKPVVLVLEEWQDTANCGTEKEDNDRARAYLRQVAEKYEVTVHGALAGTSGALEDVNRLVATTKGRSTFMKGAAFNLCGSISVNGGTNLMKKATMDKRREVWFVGVAFFIGGNLLNIASLSMAPQSFLSCLGAVQFISNVFFASCLLGEPITKRIIGATALILVGVVIAISCAPKTESQFTMADLYDNYNSSYFAYLSGQLVLLVICQLLYHRAPPDAGYAPVCYAAVSAIIGTQAIIQTKCVSEMMRKRPAHLENADEQAHLWWFPYAVGLVLISCQGFWLVRMQQALALFSGVVIIPTLQVFWTSFSILTAGLYFGEFYNFDVFRCLRFVLGLCVIFLGVYFLVPHGHVEDEEADTTFIRQERQKTLRRQTTLFVGTGLMDWSEFIGDEDSVSNDPGSVELPSNDAPRRLTSIPDGSFLSTKSDAVSNYAQPTA